MEKGSFLPYKRRSAASDKQPFQMWLLVRNLQAQLTDVINAFGNACEHLIVSMASHRPLTESERLYIRHYCKELLDKTSEAPHGPR